MKRNRTVKNTALSAMFLALCMVLPLVTGQIPKIGNLLSPMHLPVMLCGFVCGWPYGLLVGLVAPLLRSLLFAFPPLYPNAVGMAFELATYGLLCGLLCKVFPKKPAYLYLSLAIAMVGGRLVWGLARFIMAGLGGSEFSLKIFLTSGFATALPAILLQFLLIPPLVLAFQKIQKTD